MEWSCTQARHAIELKSEHKASATHHETPLDKGAASDRSAVLLRDFEPVPLRTIDFHQLQQPRKQSRFVERQRAFQHGVNVVLVHTEAPN
jgi:hypothetical protein